MIHVVVSEDGNHAAGWSDKTHEMDGDRPIGEMVKRANAAIGQIHDGQIPNDMSDPKYVIAAMTNAAQFLYGGTPSYHQVPESVSVSAPES